MNVHDVYKDVSRTRILIIETMERENCYERKEEFYLFMVIPIFFCRDVTPKHAHSSFF